MGQANTLRRALSLRINQVKLKNAKHEVFDMQMSFLNDVSPKAKCLSRGFKILILVVLIILSALFFPHSSLAKDQEPYMPASLQKVLQDVGAASDVLAIVSGGWGYSQDKAIVIGNPFAGQDKQFEIPPFEYELMEIRDHEEFYIVPPDGERHLPISSTKVKQGLIKGENGKYYDKLQVQLVILPEQYWAELKAVFGAKTSVKDVLAHFEGKTLTVEREYWFDISEPFKHNGELLLKNLKAN